MTELALKPFTYLGRWILILSDIIGDFFQYVADFLHALRTPPYRPKETLEQIYLIGWRSAPTIVFSVSFAAIVTIYEYTYHINIVIHNVTLVPGFAALLILRELGAVITGLLLTSRVGAGITAEIGTMKITEQIDALKLLSIEPMRYLVVPRFVACVLSMMVLSVFANVTALFCSMVMSQYAIGTSPEAFLSAMNHFAHFKDFGFSLIKAAAFGAVIPVISCFYGLRCQAGAEGVGTATTQAVVSNAVTIIILDFILTYIFSYFY